MDIIESILQLPDQCKQAWEESSKIEFDGYKFENIIVAGMGGSALGAHIVRSVMEPNIPFVIVNDYKLPNFANQKTLMILSSYSGNTEEVLSCAQDAKSRGCLITGMTTGGKLARWLSENNYQSYIFDPKYNQANQPRLAVGYSTFGILGLLTAMGYYPDTLRFDVEDSLSDASWERAQLEAKNFVQKAKNKLLYIFAAEHLVGNAHVFANQANETAKNFSSWFAIPEANHHLLEGLKHPEVDSLAVFLNSKNYHTQNRKRIELTKEILLKNKFEVISYEVDHDIPSPPTPPDTLTEAIEVLMFSSMLTAYLSLEYNEDPLTNPTVDYFKEKLV